MEFGKLIKKTLVSACMCFTAITAVYMLILEITNVDTDPAAIQSFRVLLFFLFSLLFSIANTIRGIKSINSILRHSAHYIICTFAFYACFLLPTVDTVNHPSHMLTGIVLFTVGYAIVVGIIAIFNSRLKANREKSVQYKKQFNKKK